MKELLKHIYNVISGNTSGTYARGVIVDASGNAVGATANALDINIKSGSLGVADIEIGAVEIKNATDDTRATVGANGLYTDVRASALPTGAATEVSSAAILAKIIATPATEAKQDTIIAKDFATQATLSALNTKVTTCNTGAVVVSSALPAGTNHIGNVVNGSAVITITPTIDTAVYATGELLFDATIVAAIARANDQRVLVHSISVVDLDDEGAAFDLIFTNDATTWGALNAVPAVADTVADGIFGHVSIGAGDYVDVGAQKIATITSVGLEIPTVTGADDIYVFGITRGTPTYGVASDLVIKIGFIFIS